MSAVNLIYPLIGRDTARSGMGQWNASLKDVSGKPEIPADRSGYREERDGSDVSHRLKVTAEGISVNVGGPCGEG
jgi:hypothetical protein